MYVTAAMWVNMSLKMQAFYGAALLITFYGSLNPGKCHSVI